MNLRGFELIILFSILSGLRLTVFAGEPSITDIVNARAESAKSVAQSSQSTASIPGYSEEKKQKQESELAAIQVDSKADNLKISGAQLRDREARKNPDGGISIMVEATDISRVTGDQCKGCEEYGKLEMFTEADKYMQDPISQMQLIKDQGCKEVENNKKRGFFKEDKTETYTDEIEEFRTCETPTTKFNCKKVLSVRCKKTLQCDYGGITKGSISEGIIFDTSKGFLTIGTDGDNYLAGQCSTHNKSVNFHIAKASMITVFKLMHVKFDDYLELKLNGHTFYVGPDGGDYVEVKNHDIEVEKERTVYDTVNNGWRFWKVGRQEKYKEKITLTEVYNGHNYAACERNTNWNREVDVDLKPYLKDGENILQMKIIVSGNGEGWLKIGAKQQCCANNEWTEDWVENCD